MATDWRNAKRSQPSRWSRADNKNYVAGVPPVIPPISDPEVLDAVCVRVRLEELQLCISTGKFDVNDPGLRIDADSTPVYDSRGVRSNTKDKILLDKMMWERQALILAAQKISPSFQPPSDYRYQEQKLTLKVPIPIKEYPDYNFIGLIIGPRGMTQKQMERDTGCKIAIRGRGSVKDGKSTNGMAFEEQLHVLITAPNAEALKKAEQMVRKLVTPMEESKNDHKRAQLRKLAEINGTLRDGYHEDMAGNDAGRRGGAESGPASCRNCGGDHSTYLCEARGTHIGIPSMSVREYFDAEYAAFCAVVGETPPSMDAKPAVDAEMAMSSFYEELGQ